MAGDRRGGLLWVFAFVAGGGLGVAATLLVRGGASADGRTAIVLPVEARDAVLSEMRMMLTSIHEILNGVARGDREAIASAASAAGTATAADPGLQEVLPQEFLALGMRTHQAFDALAGAVEAAGAGGGADTAVAHLARLTSNCVACHAAYRLAAR